MSHFEQDRNRGQGMPSALAPDSYARIAAKLTERQSRQAAWAGVTYGDPHFLQPLPVQAPMVPMQRTAAAPTGMKRFASLEEVSGAGFRRIATGMYKLGHDIWELRHAEDGAGYCLVRKREERAPDLRSIAGVGTEAAVASGAVVRTAGFRGTQALVNQYLAPEQRAAYGAAIERGAAQLVPGCPDCGAPIRWSCQGRTGPAYCARSAGASRFGGVSQLGPATCRWVGQVRQRPRGGVDLLDVRGQRIGQLTEDVGLPPPLEGEPEPPVPIAEDAFGLDQAQELFDAHEIMHGREPVYDPNAPLPAAMEEVVEVEDGGNGDGEGEGGEPGEGERYDFGDDGGEGPDSDKEGKAPPGREQQVRELKKDPDIDNPFAVAWSSYDKSHEGAAGGPGTGQAVARAGQRRHEVPELVGTKILAVRKGGVSEGVIVKLLPMGDLETDFGEGGTEPVALDMVLEPVLEALQQLVDGHGHDHEDPKLESPTELGDEPEPEPELEPEVDLKEAARRPILVTVDDLL